MKPGSTIFPIPDLDIMSSTSPLKVSTAQPTECDRYFRFECAYEFETYHRWVLNHPNLPIVSVVFYLLAIFYGQKLMSNRKPFNLKWSLFVWNASLAIFSIMGTIRATEDAINLISRIGLHNSMCVLEPDRVRSFWVFAFLMSKFVELGDTVFLVLRKRKVIFLHWYHHVTVLLFTWLAVASVSSAGRYFILMNLIAHSFMYTYYALQAIGVKAPKSISMTITTVQILQMVGGIYVILYTRAKLIAGEPCAQTFTVINSGLVMCGSYFLLFVNFFVNAYVFNSKLTGKTGQVMKDHQLANNVSDITNNNTIPNLMKSIPLANELMSTQDHLSKTKSREL